MVLSARNNEDQPGDFFGEEIHQQIDFGWFGYLPWN